MPDTKRVLLGAVGVGVLIACGLTIGIAIGPYRNHRKPVTTQQPSASSQPQSVTTVPAVPSSETTASPAVPKPASTRGIAILASDIGHRYSVDALEAFVVAGDFRPIIVDWAWITHHWERTDFDAVSALVNALRKRSIEVMAMYRPRFLGTPTVPIQVKADGSPAWDHGSEIRYTNEEARAWGIHWGTEILKQCPGFDVVIIYNPRNVDRSPEAAAIRNHPAGAHGAVAQFLTQARETWKSIKPDLRVGVVSVNDPDYWNHIKDTIDVAHPYLLIKEDVDVGADTFEMTRLASLLGDKMGANLAKVTWGENDKVEPAKLQAFNAHARQYRFGYVLWTFDTLFDSSLYDPRAVCQAMEFDLAKLEPALRGLGAAVPSPTPTVTARAPVSSATPAVATRAPVRGRNEPGDWTYFTSRESDKGDPPKLALQFTGREIAVPALADVMVLGHLPNRNWAVHPDLSISLWDSDRVLLRFGSVMPKDGESLRKAELVLDMRLSGTPPEGPFELGVYHVLERWNEKTAKWDNQPEFAPEPKATAEVQPREGKLRIDVTELVQSWIAQRSNHGMLLKVTVPLAGLQQPAPVEAYPPDAGQRPGEVYPEAQPACARTVPLLPASPQLALPSAPKWDALPWPHQAPGSTEAERKSLSDNVWIINDFPLYQGSDMFAYFHTGLDLVLDNGTLIYAMEDGWVKSIAHGAVIVATTSGPEPAFGWGYVHLGDIQVSVGQRVARGTLIGRVEFNGLAHLHLDKLYSQNPYWGEWQYAMMPNRHFTYPDDDPPVIQTPFYFFQNESDEVFAPDASGTVVIGGDVDIVVAMREQGTYAHSRENGFGDRLGVAKVACTIRSLETGYSKERASFDFTQLAIKKSPTHRDFNTELTKIAYKHPRLFGPNTTIGNKDFAYYIITNAPADKPARELKQEHSKLSWNTREFSDGDYEITVRATDATGHSATASMHVTIRNGSNG